MLRDALVVGINSYNHLPGLQAPARDAEAIAQILHSFGEFRVQRMPEILHNGVPQVGQKTPVRIQDLETALVNLFKPKGSYIPHTALFYFSGHGIQREAGICDGYLALADSNPATGFYGLSLFWLRRLLQESPVRQRIIILDCCHSGELLNFLDADPGARAGTDRLFMAASREYESAYESINGPYSVFTAALQAALDPQRSDTGIVTSHSLTHAVSQSLKGELQQPLFESSGSEIILTRCTSPTLQAQASPQDECPYRGLESFDEIHADWFYGRETLIKQMLASLKGRNFLAVVGASGAGKSSVVKAGLLPALRCGKCPNSDRWPIKYMTPTEHPLKSLAGVFLDPSLSELERAEQLRRVEAFLHDGGAGMAQLVRASLPVESQITTRSDAKPRLLLVIDQFEEVFTLRQGADAEQEQRQFLNCLVRSLQLVPDLLSIVVVLRSDIQPLFGAYDELARLIETNQILVPGLTYEQLKSVITQPAKKAGLVCDPNLVYTLLLDVIGAPGELPLLQYALTTLWEQRHIDPNTQVARLTLDAYTHLGGIRGALQTQATDLFYRLSPTEQSIAKRIFLALTQLGEGTEDTRRRVLKTELVTPQYPLELVEQVLEKLAQAKLVVLDQRHPARSHQPGFDQHTTQAGTHVNTYIPLDQNAWALGASPILACSAETATTVDIVHEALIRGWPMLRTWLDDSREQLRQLRRIEQVAQDWYDSGEPHSSEYLLSGGLLQNAELCWSTYAGELSELARRYVELSLKEKARARRESRLLQVSIPSVLLVALAVTVAQYRSAIATKTEQNQQINLMLAREKAAIAQTVLQEPESDPTTALLLSRLAAEGAATDEAQRMLRSALHTLRLQHTLPGNAGVISSIAFSAASAYLALGSDDGNVQLWRSTPNTISLEPPTLIHTFSWAIPSLTTSSEPARLKALVLSHSGDKLAAVVDGSTHIKVWDTQRGTQSFLINSTHPIDQAMFSPDGKWLATTSTDRTLTLWGADTGQLLTRITLSNNLINAQFSPDGKHLMTAESNGDIGLWAINAPSALKPYLQRTRTITHSVPLETAMFSPKGRWILTLGSDQQSRLWDAATGELQKTYTPYVQPELAKFKEAAKLSLQSGSVATAPPQKPTIVQSSFSPDEEHVALLDSSARLWMWNINTEKVWVRSLAKSSVSLQTTLHLAFSPDGEWLAVSGQPDEDTQLWPVFLIESKTGREETMLRGHQQAVTALQFSTDGHYIATGDQSGKVHLWAAETQGELPTLHTSRSAIRWIRFRQPALPKPDPQVARIVESQTPFSEKPSESTKRQSSQPLFAMAHFNQVDKWKKLLSWRRNIVLLSGSEDAQRDTQSDLPLDLLAVDVNGQLNRWKIENGPVLTSMVEDRTSPARMATVATEPASTLPVEAIAALDISLDGRSMAIARPSGKIELQQQQPDGTFGQPTQLVAPSAETSDLKQLVFSPTGEQLIGLGRDATVRLWGLGGKRAEQVLRGHQATIQTAQFSADGQHIVTASLDGTVRLWEAETGQMLRTIEMSSQINMAGFSPDGQQIITANSNGSATVFEAATGQLLHTLEGHQTSVLEAHFSPNGRQIATASADGTIWLWDAATGNEQSQLTPLQGKTEQSIRRIFFSPDSQYLATLTNDGDLQLWAATQETLLKLARDRTLRQLTADDCKQYLKTSEALCPRLEISRPYSLQR